MSVSRWVLIVAIALVVVGLLAFARGVDHHRGNEVGALGGPATLSAAAWG